MFFITITVSAQTIPQDLLKNMKPRNIGPGGMSGRVTAIDAVHSNPDIIYAGTASGGLWKSESGGITWKPIFDNEVTASIGAVAIQQSNPSVIWVGTGEGNPRNSLNGGYGIYKSLDAGKSWIPMGLEKTRHIHRIVVDPTNPDVVYAGAIGSPWGEHPERGVYKTTDGGKSWKQILFANNKTGVADLVMDPKNPNKLIATLWEHKRDPWFFNSGGKGSGLYMTHDGGDNWKQITADDGLPKGDLGRIGVAIARNKPNIVYAIVEAKKNGFYRSEDGGFTWKLVNSNSGQFGNRPFYYSEINVDPQNENRVYSIFTYVNVSEDGGKSFDMLMPAYGVDNGVHPDHHAWWIHPENGTYMIDGNDGGLNITRDGGKSWRFAGNIPVSQFYHINVDNEIPYNVYGGMQDNGSWRGPAYVWRSQGIRNSYWQEISFGDGFDVVPDRDDARYGWSMSQGGNVLRYDWETGNNYGVKPTHPDTDAKLRFNWNSAINIDPFDNSTIYFGSQFVHKSTDKGDTWSIISPDLTTNNPEKQNQSESGGLTLDATGAENHCTILVIEPSPVEKDMMWIGTDDGKVQYTTNGGNTWVDVTKNIKGLPSGSWIAQIKASNKNKGEALLIANDYRRDNYTPYAYRTKDYGKTWKRIVAEKDALSFTLAIVEDLEEPNLLFLGTDDGLYYSTNAGENWTKWTEGFPTVPVIDLVIHPREHDLVIGTFGRAAWVIDDIRPLRDLAKNSKALDSNLILFNPPTAYQAAYQEPTGSRFSADAMFAGDNRNFGAIFSYYFKPKEKAENADSEKSDTEKDSTDTKKASDSLTLKIYDGDRLIRTLKQKAPKDAGIHKWTWYMDEAGIDRPSRNSRTRNNEPSGIDVKPGTFKAVLSNSETSSETTVTVASDPRLNINQTAINEVYNTSKNIETMQQLAADVVKQLVESKEIAEKYKKDLSSLDKDTYKDAIDQSTKVIKEIEAVINIFLGKQDDRQGIVRSPEINVMQRIYTAASYVRSRQNGLTVTETNLINHAKNDLTKAIEKTNEFYTVNWSNYKKNMESLSVSIFKPTKTF